MTPETLTRVAYLLSKRQDDIGAADLNPDEVNFLLDADTETIAALRKSLDSLSRQVTRESAETVRYRGEVVEYQQLTGTMARLLTLTANALKGEPDQRHLHDWSDLPTRAGHLRTAAAEVLADAAAYGIARVSTRVVDALSAAVYPERRT